MKPSQVILLFIVSFYLSQLAHYGTWFVGGSVALVIVNVILRGMKR